MKLGPRLTLTFVGLVLVGPLVSLTPPVGPILPLPVVGSGSWFDRWREPASDWPPTTASVVRSMEFDQARAAPVASLVLDCAWSAGNTGPPGQETHGPPEPIGPGRVAGQARQLKPKPSSNLIHEITGLQPPN